MYIHGLDVCMMISERNVISLLPPKLAEKTNMRVYNSLASTNDKAKELAREEAPGGTFVVARSQTAGRGRLGRSFFSPEDGGLYMSALYRPDCSAERLMPLTAFTAVAVCGAVERVTGSRPGAKWPNDIMAGGKKLCGILTELSLDASGGVRGVVIGIGVNAAQESFPPELEHTATSFRLAYGATPPLSALCAAIIEALGGAVAACLDGTRGEWLRRYREICVTLGREVTLTRGAEPARGVAVGVDDNAALLVRMEDGSVEAVSCGEALVHEP